MKSKNLIHLVSVALLFLWGAVLLYFYASQRVAHYLPPDGIFRPMVLVAGIGLVILGLFNLATTQYAAADCCGHDHDNDHDHGHNHGHNHGHDHGHDHDHAHQHEHDHDGSCGHDHAHGHEHHDHEEHTPAHAPHDHGHGILEESGAVGRIVAILIIAAPVTWAAIRTPDQYSANAVVNKGLYNQNYSSTARAEQFSLRGDPSGKSSVKKAAPAKPAVADAPPATAAAPSATNLPPAKVAADAPPGATPSTPPVSATTPPAGAKEAKSYGGFTLADLEAQVPKSKAGNFILDVPELYYTAGDKEVQSVITGQMVETVAQVLPEKVNNEDGKRLRIFRMLVQCCAADARPYSIPAQFAEKAPEFKDMTWVKVTGKMNYKQEGGQTVPLIEVTKMEETTAPDNAMVY